MDEAPKLIPLTQEQVQRLKNVPGQLINPVWVKENPCKDVPYREPMGYHMYPIPKGEYGKLSKIVEEAYEVYDAMAQSCRLMMLVELADLAGAIRGYLEAQGLRLEHAQNMAVVVDGTIGELIGDAVSVTDCKTRECELRRFARILVNIEKVLGNYGLGMHDLWLMERATHRAFRNGVRDDRRGP